VVVNDTLDSPALHARCAKFCLLSLQEPKRNANEEAVAAWERKRAKKNQSKSVQLSPTVSKRAGRTNSPPKRRSRQITDSSSSSSDHDPKTPLKGARKLYKVDDSQVISQLPKSPSLPAPLLPSQVEFSPRDCFVAEDEEEPSPQPFQKVVQFPDLDHSSPANIFEHPPQVARAHSYRGPGATVPDSQALLPSLAPHPVEEVTGRVNSSPKDAHQTTKSVEQSDPQLPSQAEHISSERATQLLSSIGNLSRISIRNISTDLG
jgi:hypothetical protein